MKTIQRIAVILLLSGSASAAADCGGELELAGEDYKLSEARYESSETTKEKAEIQTMLVSRASI